MIALAIIGVFVANKEIDKARSEGYTQGHSVGYTEGQNLGYANGKKEGYDEGYNAGYDEGFDAGYSACASIAEEDIKAAYKEGYQNGVTNTGASVLSELGKYFQGY